MGRQQRSYGRGGHQHTELAWRVTDDDLDLVNIAVQLAHRHDGRHEVASAIQAVPDVPAAPPITVAPRPKSRAPRPAISMDAYRHKPVRVLVADRAEAVAWLMPDAGWCGTKVPDTEVIFYGPLPPNGKYGNIAISSVAKVRARGPRRGSAMPIAS